jgi:hypothetical protein
MLLDAPTVDARELAGGVIAAADQRLLRLRADPALGYCFWLLARLASAAKMPGFVDELAQLGIRLPADVDAPTFVELIAERVEDRLAELPPNGHFGDIAQQSLRSALSTTVGQHGQSFIQGSLEDLRDAVAAHATTSKFGALAHRFFAEFLGRSMLAFIDRELAQHIGEARAFATVGNCLEFQRALALHATQSARIVERFAGEWFSLHHWQDHGAITPENTDKFVGVALKKLRDELLLQRETA